MNFQRPIETQRPRLPYWLAFAYLVLVIAVPFLTWQQLVLQDRLQLPVFPQGYTTAICFLAPLVWVPMATFSLLRIWRARVCLPELLASFFGPTIIYVLITRDLETGHFWTLEKCIFVSVFVFSVREVFYGGSREAISTANGSQKRSVSASRRLKLGVLLAFLMICVTLPFVTPMLLLADPNDFFKIFEYFLYSELNYGEYLRAIQALSLSIFSVLGFSMSPARTKVFVVSHLLVTLTYLFNIWYGFYFLDLKAFVLGSTIFATAWIALRIVLSYRPQLS